jgi:tetratricopeptide (TPR) repeat protein
MPRRYYFWTIILFILNCVAIFDRRNDFEKAINYYQKAEIEKAINHFEKYHLQYPLSDTTLYYIYDCYRRQGNQEAKIQVLEKLVALRTNDVQVYSVLLKHYYVTLNYGRFFTLYGSLPESVKPLLDAQYVLTRQLYSQLLAGTDHITSYNDPVQIAVAKGYLPRCPDGNYYRYDTMTVANLIIALDILLEPIYPKHFYPMNNISERSFIYLPYMRLVDLEILTYDRQMDPNTIASLSMAVQAIQKMGQRGFID